MLHENNWKRHHSRWKGLKTTKSEKNYRTLAKHPAIRIQTAKRSNFFNINSYIYSLSRSLLSKISRSTWVKPNSKNSKTHLSLPFRLFHQSKIMPAYIMRLISNAKAILIMRQIGTPRISQEISWLRVLISWIRKGNQ